MPEEKEKCAPSSKSGLANYVDSIRRGASIIRESNLTYWKVPKELKSVTGMAAKEISGKKYSPLIFVLLGVVILVIGYFVIEKHNS